MDSKSNNVVERQSNIELLRIASMFLIVCHHYAVHGALRFPEMAFSLDKLILQFLSYGGKLGVNLFVLISGFFLVNSRFRAEKTINLWMNVSIYSIVILIVFMLVGSPLEFKTILENCLPIPFSTWWFVTSYFILYLFTDYINLIIRAFTRKQLDNLIFLLIILYSVLPTLLLREMLFSSNLMWFFLLYLLAARVRLYPPKRNIFQYSLWFGLAGYLLCLLSCVLFDLIGMQYAIFDKNATCFSSMNSFPMLFCSYFIFQGFVNFRIQYNKIINLVAASMFGVYLIHDNILIRPFLWKKLFLNSSYVNWYGLLLHAVIAIGLTFVICSLISILYNLTFGKWIGNFISKTYPSCVAHFFGFVMLVRKSYFSLRKNR